MSNQPLLGAFARIFRVQTPAELVDAFHAHTLTQVQLNLSTFGLPTIPTTEEVSTPDLDRIAHELDSGGLRLWGISATYNTAHPDADYRSSQAERAAEFIGRIGGTRTIAATLCSGSRNPTDMWGFHPDTGSEAAWRDFRESLDILLPAAERGGVLLAIEPEPANTVLDVDRALRLQQELGGSADHIGFILDPANLIMHVDEAKRRYTLERAFAELGPRTICVHAKDTVAWASTLRGTGVVDYELVARLYHDLPQRVPLIIQDASEAELADVVALLCVSFSEVAR